MVVAAHSDDETIGLGGQLHSMGDVTLVHVTDGAPRPHALQSPDRQEAVAQSSDGGGTDSDGSWREYAHLRRKELLEAMAIAGISESRCLQLDFADQDASYHLLDVTQRLADLIRERAPEIVFTHAYEGGHPDHDATAFAVHCAVWCAFQSLDRAPLVIEFESYHRSPEDETLEAGRFLKPPGASFDNLLRVYLDQASYERKRRMLDCFQSQRSILGNFGFRYEEFRFAPKYDFLTPPHSPPLFYDLFDWGITSSLWSLKAAEALNQLDLVKANS